jgi:hypothetical protein
MIEMPTYPPGSALTWVSTEARSAQEATIELAFRETTLRSVVSARMPELVPSPGAVPRPNPTSREEVPARSMYVDENGETYINVHPDEFPLPPPIFPLPPPHGPSVVAPPKLRLLTGVDVIYGGTTRSPGVASSRSISQGGNSNKSNRGDRPISGISSVVYGSDIVAASGSRNLLHNPSFRRGTLRSTDDDYADEYLDMPDRSALSSQFSTTPLPISARSGRLSRMFDQDEGDTGLPVVEEEGPLGSAGMSAVGGKRYSFGMPNKGKGKERERQSAGKGVLRVPSGRRSREANSMGGSGIPLRTARTSAMGEGEGEGGQWSVVPIMVVEQIPTSPISAPVLPTTVLSPGLLSPSLVSPVGRGNGLWISPSGRERTRTRTRTRLVPRGPRSPEQENAVKSDERLPQAYMVSPEAEGHGRSFAMQD